jgi:putative sugar O-methyltransferase
MLPPPWVYDARFGSRCSEGPHLSKLNLSSAVAARLLAFVNSDVFKIRSDVAKSEYWKYFGDQLRVQVSGSSADVTGRSGFYVPPPASTFTRLTRKLARAVKQPSHAGKWLGRAISSRFELPRLMPYEQAFDAVMGSAEVSMPIRSVFALDHRKLLQLPKVFASAASVKRHYRQWSGYEASANILNDYYYQNILRAFIEDGGIKSVLEIGAGNGNLASILRNDFGAVRIVIVDLPQTLAVSIPFLSSLFPSARIAMPNEIQAGGLPDDADFAFLTVDQLQLLPDDSFDLAINCHSFQEMTRQQISIYFELIQRACRDSGLFFSANRIEKIPCGADPFGVEQSDPPNRMAEYPWNSRNSVLLYEISRLSRLVQLDSVAIRLERIQKQPQPQRMS